MKNLILIFSAVLFAKTMFAQSKYSFELHSGTNYLQTISENPDKAFTYKNTLGFQAGISGERKLGSRFAFGLGAEIITLKYTLKDINIEDFYFNGNIKFLDFVNTDSYVKIPFFIKYYPLKERKVNPYLKLTFSKYVIIQSVGKLENYQILDENLNLSNEFYKSHLDYLNNINEQIYFRIKDKYTYNMSFSIGATVNVSEKIITGLCLTMHFAPLYIQTPLTATSTSHVVMPISINLQIGFKL